MKTILITSLIICGIAQAEKSKMTTIGPKLGASSLIQKSISEKAEDDIFLGNNLKQSQQPLVIKSLKRAGNEGGGGGNTINGKPIELYAGDLTIYPSYKKIVEPILKKIDSKIPNYSHQMRKVLTDKIWYFVPVSLTQLPSNITGIHFDSDQTIVQLEKSVWVDQRGFDSLNEKEQSLLIIHELVMSVVMKQQNYKISSKESDFVRLMTLFITKNPDSSAEALNKMLLKQLEFYIPLFVAPTYYSWLNSNNPMEQLYIYLEGLKTDSDLPNGRDGSCEMSFRYDPNTRAVIVNAIDKKSNKGSVEVTVTDLPHLLPFEYYIQGGVYGKVHASLTYNFIEGGARAPAGEIRRAFIIFNDGLYKVWEVSVRYLICRDDLGSGSCEWEEPTRDELRSKGLKKEDQVFCEGKKYNY